ncbi:MAG: hypothetical protein KBB14_00980 [Thermoanaerobaculia bacterium]|nr:hypothetical protein [Thermoanaerobaculia bacterium]
MRTVEEGQGVPVSVFLRPRLRRELERSADASPTKSFALVAAPGFEGAAVFEFIKEQWRKKRPSGVLIALRGETFRRPDGVSEAIQELRRAVGGPEGHGSTPLTENAKRLREEGRRRFGETGEPVVVALSSLESVSRGSRMEEVGAFLDLLQEGATESPRWLAVWSLSEEEPARICEQVAWSPFYKVYGSRIYFAAGFERDVALPWIGAALQRISVPAGVSAAAVFEATGGIPEAVEMLLERLGEAESLEAAWELARTHGGERLSRFRAFLQRDAAVLAAIGRGMPIRDADRAAIHRLTSFGVVTKTAEGAFSLVAPGLTKRLLEGCGGSPEEPAAERNFVRGLQLVPGRDNQELVASLCAGTFYSELEVLQSREGEAWVARVDRENEKGQRLRPQVLKLHQKESVKREVDRAREARKILGSGCPEILRTEYRGSLGGYIAEFACADSLQFELRTFEAVFRAPGQDAGAAEKMLRRVLTRVLAGFYRDASLKSVPPSKYYSPPTCEQIDGDEVITKGRSWRMVRKSLFETKRNLLLSEANHGDLNPRNFLIDGAENIHVIDFSTFGGGPVARDFCRLEAEIALKLCPFENVGEAESVLTVLCTFPFSDAGAGLPLRAAIHSALRCIRCVREAYLEMCPPEESDWNPIQDYQVGLAATAARMSLFRGYLSEEQRRMALTYLGRLAEMVIGGAGEAPPAT